MNTFKILCLANSFKHGGRCIAGIKTDRSGWIRPVSCQSDGTLTEENCKLANGKFPQIFDVIKINCTEPRPSPHQPENWVVSPKKWMFLGRPETKFLKSLLKSEVERSKRYQYLLENPIDRLDWQFIQENPLESSLKIIAPKNITWKITTPDFINRKYRVSFQFCEVFYDLPITDPEWRETLSQLPDGDYSAAEAIEHLNLPDFHPDNFLFTLSLGEPFQPRSPGEWYCFKIVAAVMNLDIYS
ncbi:dual OB domain-containing protein [Baaleninema sp.]|uniref:dual OB domain-containing protein n=1 Tax=Baaleninema sp. TaxID=3101197 RepID=UPI003D07360C